MLFPGHWSRYRARFYPCFKQIVSPILHAIMIPCSCFEKSSNVRYSSVVMGTHLNVC